LRRRPNPWPRPTLCLRRTTSPPRPPKTMRRRRNFGHGNRRATRGRRRRGQYSPRARGWLFPGWDGSTAAVAADFDFNQVWHRAVENRDRVGFNTRRAPATADGAEMIRSAPPKQNAGSGAVSGRQRRGGAKFQPAEGSSIEIRSSVLCAARHADSLVHRLPEELWARPYINRKLRSRSVFWLQWEHTIPVC
jgi:hypothetical protein